MKRAHKARLAVEALVVGYLLTRVSVGISTERALLPTFLSVAEVEILFLARPVVSVAIACSYHEMITVSQISRKT